jgi:Zn finger protein HypA/HybF involved in hydrogenase expression
MRYTNILERRPCLGFSDQIRIFPCEDCGKQVRTVSRNCKRCPSCAQEKKRADLAAKDARKRAAR